MLFFKYLYLAIYFNQSEYYRPGIGNVGWSVDVQQSSAPTQKNSPACSPSNSEDLD